MFENILVCLDGSSLAEQILPYATEEARHFGSKLVLLEVTAPPSAVVEPITGFYHATSLKKVLRQADEAEAYLEQVTQSLKDKGLNVEYEAMQGDPGETIVRYAQENDIGLIALCTHGHSGLGRLVFGSVADHILKRAGLPILIIRPQEKKK